MQVLDPGLTIGFGSRRYPLVLPKLRDPRLHLAAVIFSLQALGQTVLGFDLSIAQILLSIGTCAVLELAITFWQHRMVVWPASAMLTGNGVAFILRVPGTEHGDYWSVRGGHIFVAVAALSLLSKYVIRVGDRHLFNPSNLGLVVCFLVLGSQHADPQDLWWGPISPGLAAALVVIVAGGAFVTLRQGLLPIAASFFVTFALGTGALATSGHCMAARWSSEPVCDGSYWWVLMSSPEILVFCFFMITDPRTIPTSRTARLWFGVAVGVVATLLVAPQRTEFATKVAILGALVAVCAARPLLDAWARPLRRVWLAVPAVVVFLGVTVLAGTNAREPRLAGGALPVVAVDRAPVDLPDGAVPEVTIGGSARRTQPPLTAERAQRMGRDLVDALVIEAEALRTGDRAALETAVAGERLADDLRSLTQDGAPELRSYDFETLEVVLLRDPLRPQDPPRLGVAATGTVRSEGGAEEPFDGSFALADVGGYFVVTAQL